MAQGKALAQWRHVMLLPLLRRGNKQRQNLRVGIFTGPRQRRVVGNPQVLPEPHQVPVVRI
jgi:hypothetical protein